MFDHNDRGTVSGEPVTGNGQLTPLPLNPHTQPETQADATPTVPPSEPPEALVLASLASLQPNNVQVPGQPDPPQPSPAAGAVVPAASHVVPPWLSEPLQERFEKSGNNQLMSVPEDKQKLAEIEALQERHALTAGDILRLQWRRGRFIATIWYPRHREAQSYAEAGQILNISWETAEACSAFYASCNEPQMEELISMGFTWTIVFVLFQIEDKDLRWAKQQEIAEKKITAEQLTEFVAKLIRQIDRDKQKERLAAAKRPPGPPSDPKQDHQAAVMVSSCENSADVVSLLNRHLQKIIAGVQRMRERLLFVNLDNRIDAIKEVVAGFEALYVTTKLVEFHVGNLNARLPESFQGDFIPAPDEALHDRVHELWIDLLNSQSSYGQRQTEGTGIKALGKAGKDVQHTCIAILEQLRRYEDYIGRVEEMTIVDARPRVYGALRWAFGRMGKLPKMLDDTLAAVLPKEQSGAIGGS